MKKILGLMAVAGVLAACDDRRIEEVAVPDDTTVTPEGPASSTAASVGDIEVASLEDGIVTVIVPLDGEDTLQQFTEADDPLNGYDRFELQQSGLNRAFSALVGTSSDDEELVAVLVMDGGQINRFFGGANLEQNAFSAPPGGFSYYQGNYAGFVNVGPPRDPENGAPDVAIPNTVGEVTGQVFLIADFTDNNVEGGIYNRQADFGELADFDDLIATLPTELALINTEIDPNGRFTGIVEQSGEQLVVGTYAGAFGGTDAEYAGGVLDLKNGAYEGAVVTTPDTEGAQALVDAIATSPTLQEYGLFVIGQCPSGPDSCFPSQ